MQINSEIRERFLHQMNPQQCFAVWGQLGNWWSFSAQALGFRLRIQMVKRPSAATGQSEAASGKRTKTAVEATAPKSKCIAVSVKVASLRAAGYQDFETWLQDKGNLYVGRRGRIFIHDGSSKRIFHFPSSKWQNPFAVSKTTSRQMACEKFRSALLDGSLKDADALSNFWWFHTCLLLSFLSPKHWQTIPQNYIVFEHVQAKERDSWISRYFKCVYRRAIFHIFRLGCLLDHGNMNKWHCGSLGLRFWSICRETFPIQTSMFSSSKFLEPHLTHILQYYIYIHTHIYEHMYT